ncbi:MAG: cytochrome c biogenesis protein CcdA [bacterium]|nr:cytochrome c biogenesis protein CcdA [bacterium]
MQQTSKLKAYVIVGILSLAVVFGIGLFWFLFLAPNLGAGAELGVMGWFLFSFAAGLTMIVLPCTLPLAFVIVPLSMGKGMVKGLGMALSFGAGVALMLSAYGVIAAALGKAGISFLGAGGEDFKNWIYFFAGIFAYAFALGEIGLLKFRMPSYAGSAPDFIQKRRDYAKAFLLGLFLGNVGIGCPHPATPLILIEIASSGDIFYGWALFFVHAIGRVVPLLFLALLGILGVNGLSWLVARKDKIERATGWAMVFVGGFILTLGLFSHDWWVNSGQHNMLEKITQEDWFTARINTQLETAVPHTHGVAMGTGIFGQPLEWGNWFVVLLWIIPFWWYYRREKRRVLGTPALQIQKLGERMRRIEEERRGLEITLHIPESAEGIRVKALEEQMDGLVKERMVLEEAMRYGAESGMRDPVSQKYEEDALHLRRNWYLTITVLLIAVFYFFLPFWFMNFKGLEGGHADESPHATMTATTKVSDAIKTIDAGVKVPMPAFDESKPHTH